jgi:hypothetical protein
MVRLDAPLSVVSVIVPFTEPLTDGEKATVNVVLWAGARGRGVEIPLTAKSPLLMLIDEMVVVLPPEFVTVTLCELDWPIVTVPKERLLGDAASTPEVTPVPLNDTFCGLLVELLVTESTPVKLPAEVGWNSTAMLQFAPAASVEPQELLSENGAPTETLLIVSVDVLVLVSVTIWDWLPVFTVWSPKFRLVGLMDAVTAEAAMLTEALADLVVSAALVAVTVTLPPEGTLAGAV